MTDDSRVELWWHERTLMHERPLVPGVLSRKRPAAVGPGSEAAGEQVGSADVHNVEPGVAAGLRSGGETAVAAG
jgi:hypothetical protein